jgi:hypothetical protein
MTRVNDSSRVGVRLIDEAASWGGLTLWARWCRGVTEWSDGVLALVTAWCERRQFVDVGEYRWSYALPGGWMSLGALLRDKMGEVRWEDAEGPTELFAKTFEHRIGQVRSRDIPLFEFHQCLILVAFLLSGEGVVLGATERDVVAAVDAEYFSILSLAELAQARPELVEVALGLMGDWVCDPAELFLVADRCVAGLTPVRLPSLGTG